ncbi:MAG TPA: FtsX-like permease family protein [Acidimicrobiales bacterium]|nr:FtsX-like permease family protein [Acidimicrobiales bacterium]
MTISSLWARKRRLVGTSIAIAIGVAFLTGTLVLGDTLSANFRKLFTDVSANTDVVVRNATVVKEGGAPDSNRGLIDESLIDAINGVDGVARAEGQVVGYGSLYGRDGEPIGGNGPPRQAGSWITSPGLNPYTLVEGRAPERPDEVVINRGAAKAGDLHLGDRTVVQTPDPNDVTIVGIATFGDTDGLGQTTWTAFTLPAAQDVVVHQPGKVSSILVTAEPGVSSAALRDRITNVLPAGTEAITGTALAEERIDDIAKTFLNMLRTFLVVFALIALTVATLSINNTFAITIAQRTRELALLRAVGASRRQVRGAVTLEALLIGTGSGLVGLAGGLGIAGLLKGLFDAFGGALPAGGMDIRPRSLLIGFAAGVFVTLVAAQAPARRASTVAPVEALREADVEPRQVTRRRIVAAAVLLVTGLTLTLSAASSGQAAWIGLGALVLVIGTLAAAPVVVGPAVRILGVVLRRTPNGSGRLAAENARRQPRRTAATATALVIGVTVVSLFTVFAASMKASLEEDIAGGFRADLAVNTAAFGGNQLSPRVVDELVAAPGVQDAVALGTSPALVDGKSTLVTATNPGVLGSVVELDVHDGSLADLGAAGAAISETKAKDNDWSVGSTLAMTFSDGVTQQVTVRAVYADSRIVGNVVVPTELWTSHVTQPTFRTVFVNGADGTSASELRAAIEPIAQRFGGDVQNRAEYIAAATNGLDLLLGIVYVLLALAIVIALLGIGNTLSLAVHERRHEIGLLRAVGQTRRQSRAVLRLESMIVSSFGTGVGLVLGTYLGWVLFAAVSTGATTLAVPIVRLVIVAVLGALAGMLAAGRPARRAARLPILDAIAAS